MIRELKLIYKIWKWHDRTFKDLPLEQQQLKFAKEVDEYKEAKKAFNKSPYPNKTKYSPQVLEETADIIISGLNLLKYPDIFERVAVKHSINTHRTWEGTQHKESGDA